MRSKSIKLPLSKAYFEIIKYFHDDCNHESIINKEIEVLRYYRSIVVMHNTRFSKVGLRLEFFIDSHNILYHTFEIDLISEECLVNNRVLTEGIYDTMKQLNQFKDENSRHSICR